jgi:hypothetical protein
METKRKFITSVVDAEVEQRRDRKLAQRKRNAAGKRGQPPSLDRLRAVTIYVERLVAEGVPFGTARASRMNKLVRNWLNERAKETQDKRKSRRKQVTPDAVRELLRQVEKHRQ